MAVMVTGCRGQLGGCVLRHLVDAGVPAMGCDRAAGGTDPASTLEVDLARLPTDYRWPEEVDVLLHLAGYRDAVDPTADGIRNLFAANLESVAGALRACGDTVRHIVLVSSISVYPASANGPRRDSCPADPLSLYGASKWLGEQAFLVHQAAQPDVGSTTIRLAQVYGPGSGDHLVLYRLIDRALAGEPLALYCLPELRRDYIHLDDAVRAIALAVERRPEGVWNVGSGAGTTMGEIADAVREATGVAEPCTFGNHRGDDLMLQTEEYHRATGFVPRITLREGVAREVRRIRAVRERGGPG